MPDDIRPYFKLSREQKDAVHESYSSEWWMCLNEEIPTSLTRRDRKRFLDSKEEARKLGVKYSKEQWERDSDVFPDGQNVLLVDGQVAFHIRSNIISVPGFPSYKEWVSGGMQDNSEEWWSSVRYPQTWYKVGDSPRAKRPIVFYKVFDPSMMEDCHDVNGNILVNFAVTFNNKVKAKRGVEKLATHQVENVAGPRNIVTHTFTPWNGYNDAVSKGVIKEGDMDGYLFHAFGRGITSPVGIHTEIMARRKYGDDMPGEDELLRFKRSRVPIIFLEARIKPDAGNICGITAYTGPGLDTEKGWHERYKR